MEAAGSASEAAAQDLAAKLGISLLQTRLWGDAARPPSPPPAPAEADDSWGTYFGRINLWGTPAAPPDLERIGERAEALLAARPGPRHAATQLDDTEAEAGPAATLEAESRAGPRHAATQLDAEAEAGPAATLEAESRAGPRPAATLLDAEAEAGPAATLEAESRAGPRPAATQLDTEAEETPEPTTPLHPARAAALQTPEKLPGEAPAGRCGRATAASANARGPPGSGSSGGTAPPPSAKRRRARSPSGAKAPATSPKALATSPKAAPAPSALRGFLRRARESPRRQAEDAALEDAAPPAKRRAAGVSGLVSMALALARSAQGCEGTMAFAEVPLKDLAPEDHGARPQRLRVPPLQAWRCDHLTYHREPGSPMPTVRAAVLNVADRDLARPRGVSATRAVSSGAIPLPGPAPGLAIPLPAPALGRRVQAPLRPRELAGVAGEALHSYIYELPDAPAAITLRTTGLLYVMRGDIRLKHGEEETRLCAGDLGKLAASGEATVSAEGPGGASVRVVRVGGPRSEGALGP